MHIFAKRLKGLLIAICMPLVLVACGGGSGTAVETVTISGTAVKGPIKGALVEVFTLNKNNGAEGVLLGRSTSDTSGGYRVTVPKAKAVAPLLIKVKGQVGSSYAREAVGVPDANFTAAESFHAVLDSFDAAKNDSYAVTPLTDAAYQQLQKFVTQNPDKPVTTSIISAVNARIATLFNVGNILLDNPTSADSSYTQVLTIIDQMVTESGTGNTLQAMNIINQGLVDVAKPEYQQFRTAFVTAATKADLQNNLTVQAILASLANPPAEPDLTDTTAPNQVTGLIAVAAAETATTSSISLSWNVATTPGANKVTGYEIYRYGTKIASANSTGYLDKGLSPSTTYLYYIIAFDAAGNRSIASATVSATTPASPNLSVTVDGELSTGVLNLPKYDIFKPTAPTNLTGTATALTATASSVALTWSVATDDVAVTRYDVYRDSVKIGTSTIPSYSDSSVTSGVEYSYYVVAIDAAGNSSPASTAFSITPTSPNLGVTVGGQVQAP